MLCLMYWIADDLPDVRDMSSRPGSSRYRVLPAIGKQASCSSDDAPISSSEVTKTSSKGVPKPIQSSSSATAAAAAALVKPHPPKLTTAKTPRTVSDTKKSAVKEKGPSKVLPSNDRHLSSSQSSSSACTSGNSSHPEGVQLRLALKLPSGERLEGQFRSTDRLRSLLQFASTKSVGGAKVPRGGAIVDWNRCQLVRGDTRELIKNLNVSIRSVGLSDRTLLFVQLPP